MAQSIWTMTRRGVATITSVAGVAALLAVAACDKPADPSPASASSAATPAGMPSLVGSGGLPAGHPPTSPQGPLGAKPAAPADEGLVWEAPAAWEKVDHPSSMRKATYRIKGVDEGADAEMSVTQVGGGVDANITRWEGQYKDKKGETKRETKKVGGFDVIVVEIHGTLAGGGMPGMPSTDEKTEQALLAAIVMTPGAPHFFKMIGPDKTVSAARGDFDALVGTFRDH